MVHLTLQAVFCNCLFRVCFWPPDVHFFFFNFCCEVLINFIEQCSILQRLPTCCVFLTSVLSSSFFNHSLIAFIYNSSGLVLFSSFIESPRVSLKTVSSLLVTTTARLDTQKTKSLHYVLLYPSKSRVMFSGFRSLCRVSRCGPAVRRVAGRQKDLGSIRFGSPFSSLQKLWFMDTVL